MRFLLIEERESGDIRVANSSSLEVYGKTVEDALSKGMAFEGIVERQETADAAVRNLFDASSVLDRLMGRR